MNWKRGVFRIWLTASAFWWVVAAMIAWVQLSSRPVSEAGLSGNVDYEQRWLIVGSAFAAPFLVAGVAIAFFRIAAWITNGFRKF